MGNWTLQDVPDLQGRVIIVTGANSGLGFEAAKAFSLSRADVVLAFKGDSTR